MVAIERVDEVEEEDIERIDEKYLSRGVDCRHRAQISFFLVLEKVMIDRVILGWVTCPDRALRSGFERAAILHKNGERSLPDHVRFRFEANF